MSRFNLTIIIILILLVILLVLSRKKYKNHTYRSESLNIFQEPGYYRHFNKLDRELRKCGSNSSECQRYYQKNILDFSKLERKMLDQVVQDIHQLRGSNFSKIFRNIKFSKVNSNIENGMPHTRKNVIVFSDRYYSQMLEKFQLDPGFIKNDTFFLRLIAHEQFHIFQRLHPEVMSNFYQNFWNLKLLHKKLPPHLLEVNRTNPDALPSLNWLFPLSNGDYALPLCVFQEKRNHINDTVNIWVRVKIHQGKVSFGKLDRNQRLSDLSEYGDYFGYYGANNYHPHEISASLFEDLFLSQILSTPKPISEGFRKLAEFFL